MSKHLSSKRSSSSSDSDSDEVEWSERKTDSNDWFNTIERKCTLNVKSNKKVEQKRAQDMKEEKIRFQRELNPYFRDEVNKTFVENPDFGQKDSNFNTSVSTNAYKSVSLTERNALNAKLLKAEMLGNQQLVNELKNKIKELEDNQSIDINTKEDNVREEYYSVEKKPNEESMSVKEMFFREKRSTVEDENKRFIASSSKTVRNPDDEYEDIRQKHKKQKFHNRSDTKVRYHKSEESDNRCKQCFANIAKHLILTNGDNTLITLTPYEPFTYGYCSIISKSHSNVCTVSSDEECLAEVMQRKNEISKLFDKQNLSVVFMETYFKRKSFSNRHILIECVPIKHKLENEAKIFFKKAIMECEEEWAMNKKLVEINGKCVTKLIPKGLPYFWVTFGSKNNGFAHVIEDEEMFSQDFGKEIIAGLLDIEPNKWLKPKYQNYEEQYKRVISIKNLWNRTFS